MTASHTDRKGSSGVGSTWARYRARPEAAERNALILYYAPLVKFVANRIRSRLPQHVRLQDLVSYGLGGLIEAIERFDPERGVKFETFATPRIHGAIMDELRALDWAPRSVRLKARRLREGNEELAQQLGRWPSDAEVAEHLDLRPAQIAETRAWIEQSRLARLDEPVDRGGVPLADLIPDPGPADPLNEAESRDLRERLSGAITLLPEKERTVLGLYYDQQLRLREIGNLLGVTESRVCQIHADAIRALRNLLQRYGHTA
ncbi:MAG: FliA/WhiG family RNA polymerase sigma factor [Acidimicrobiia bacterium]